MSAIVEQFDPATAGTTQFTAPNGSANGALVFWNESNISVDLAFANGDTMYLPAWYHRHKCGATGSVTVQWATNTQLNSALPPMSAIIVEAYASGEQFPADGPLVRQTNGDASVSNATSVTNTGFGVDTQFIFAEVSGDSSGSFIATNDGQLQLGNTSENGQLTIKGRDSQQVIASNDSVSALDSLGHFLAILATNGFSIQDTGGNIRAVLGTGGKLSLNNAAGSTISSIDFNGFVGSGKGTLHLGQVSVSDTLDTDASGNTSIKSASTGTGSVSIQPNKTGTNIVTVTNTQVTVQNGAAIDYETAGTVLTGGTSGTVTVLQDFIGLTKRVIVLFNNFRTAGAAQTIALPTAFTFGAEVRAWGIGNSAGNGGVQFISGVSAQTIHVLTTLAVLGGSVTNATGNVLYENSIGYVIAAFDTLSFQASGTGGHTGFLMIEGQ